MKRNIIKKDSEVKVTVVTTLLNEHQACNDFRFTGTTRTHVLKKYKGQEHTRMAWERFFSSERLI